ncbi:unnamed protein product [Prorocentrum cordatum]|uniref:RanBP2-type domain-containing protein n=1 Tax=Prorocentrum cordatum TaxID=2364126 RepID=A0ABN9PUM6_9DINO|nr:unnamed protein product [Polarella glacialis]
MADWAPPWRGGCSGKSRWSCSCGATGNYATRKHCRGCGAAAPRRPSTFKEALLGPSKREVAMQKKLDVLTQERTALKGSGKVGKGEMADWEKEAPQVDLARLCKRAQACKSERGENSEEYNAAPATYQAARAEKDNGKPHSVQLTQAKHARGKLEKEVEASAKDASWYEQQLEEARAKYENNKEQLQVARAKEQGLRVQDCGVRESPEFLKAMQRQFDGAIDGSGVTKEEYQQASDMLGKVVANAKQEDAGALGHQEHHYLRSLNYQNSRLKSRNGSGQAGYQKKPHLISESDGRRCAPAWPSKQPNDSGDGSERNRKPMHDTVTLWTYNGTGWGTIKDEIMEEMQGLQSYAVQGHHLNTDKLAVVAQSMKGPNGEPDASAGVAVVVPKRVGMSYVFGKDDWHISPQASPGRAAAAWLSVGRGIVLATVYLWTAEGMTSRNTQLITHVIGKLQSSGVPWVIGGDFQVAPEVMASVAGVKVAKATVVTANAACGTCRHACGNSEIDYVVAANSVAPQVGGVAVQESWPAAPHKPVGLTLKLKAVQLRVRVLEKPKELPEVPIGCVPKPPKCADVQEFSTQVAANIEWAKYMQVLEREAFQVRGMRWEASDPRAGRADVPAWRVKPLTFRGANAPTAARAATWWRWAARALHNLQGARQRLRQAMGKDSDQLQKRKRDANHAERLFQVRPHRAKYISVKDQGIRQARCDMVAAGQLRGDSRVVTLQAWVKEAESNMKTVDQQLLNDRRAKWADKLEIAAAGAAGKLHRMS